MEPPCGHKMCGICWEKILIHPNLRNSCSFCRVALPENLSEYEQMSHNFDDLTAEEYEDAATMCIRKGMLNLLQQIIEHGFDVKNAGYLIILAAQEGQMDSIEFLIRKGIEIDEEVNGMTAILNAAEDGDLPLVKFLVRKGADFKKASSHGVTPIFVASAEGHLEIVIFLAENGADMNGNSITQLSPIFGAAKEGHLDVVKYLAENGAQASESLITIAAFKGHHEIVEYLAQRNFENDINFDIIMINLLTEFMAIMIQR